MHVLVPFWAYSITKNRPTPCGIDRFTIYYKVLLPFYFAYSLSATQRTELPSERAPPPIADTKQVPAAWGLIKFKQAVAIKLLACDEIVLL
jgi:hypothetical protein